VQTCPTGYYKDMSTGRPLCTKVCPSPDWFGDPLALPKACVQTCSFGSYGDQNSSARLCVSVCSGGYYGLTTGSRQCLTRCPSGTWGERNTKTCATAPFFCMNLTTNPFPASPLPTWTGGYAYNVSVFAFADNSTRLCIFAN
jgi:hypothetical protein